MPRMRNMLNSKRKMWLVIFSIVIATFISGCLAFRTMWRFELPGIEQQESKEGEVQTAGASRGEPKLPVGLSRNDWESIVVAHERAKYEIVRKGEGWQAWNPGQQWLTSFDERGFLIRQAGKRQESGARWSWGLTFVGWGFGEELTKVERRVPVVSAGGGQLRYQWTDRQNQQIEEWYRNDERGFEHGFTIGERPGTSDGTAPLHLTLQIRGGLRPERSGDGKSIAFLRDSGEVAVNYSGLKVWDAAGRELPASFLTPGAEEIRIAIDERGAEYPLTVDPVAQQAYLKAPLHDLAGEEFGFAVAVSGDTVVVGAPSDDSESRGIDQVPSYTYLYSDSGAAFVFVRNGTTWTQQAHLKSSNSWTADFFGSSVAIDKDTIVVGAPGESQATDGVDGDQCIPPGTPPGPGCGRADSFPVWTGPTIGAAYVFVRTGTTWVQQNYVKASNSEDGDRFGTAVAIHRDTIIIGANYEDSAASLNGDQTDNSAADSGAAYVFLRSGTSWVQQAYLKAAAPAPNDQFGLAVAVHNDTAVVGAVFQSDGAALSGAAFVFARNGTNWSQQAMLKSPNPAVSDWFGFAVSVYDERIVVGAFGEDTNGTDSGAAYVFKRTGGVWSQEAFLKAGDTDPDDSFGYNVAIQGEVVIVTAPNLNGLAEGTAYVFVLQSSNGASNWVQSNSFRGRRTEAFDRFGWSMGFSQETVIVGAPYEGSSATGVNGDEDNNLFSQTGAAYSFLVNPLRVTANVSANTRQINTGSVVTVFITVGNPDSIDRTGEVTFTIPDGLLLIPGSCNVATGTCGFTQEPTSMSQGSGRGIVAGKMAPAVTMSGPWTVKWNGTVPGSGSITMTFQVQIGNQSVAGTQFCLPILTSGVTSNFCFAMSAPPPGPGTTIPLESAISAQRAGSVLLYNLITSGLNPDVNDTRLTITNISQVNPINVHLFFIDGTSCAVADQFVRLTQNQTASILASDFDPGVTGYVVAVATDDLGCPIVQNDLIGDAYVKFNRGHAANLAAISISALAVGQQTCDGSSYLATLQFDGISYNRLPRTVAIDSIPSQANLNETMLVINRLGGDLSVGASRLETLSGLLFDDAESSQSFVLPGENCQLIGVLGNNFPRTAPRFVSVIPAGRTGWMKVQQGSDGAISGAVINLSSDGFSGGHNLHTLSTTSTASLTIPVYPAR
jgi:hypothetical protein